MKSKVQFAAGYYSTQIRQTCFSPHGDENIETDDEDLINDPEVIEYFQCTFCFSHFSKRPF